MNIPINDNVTMTQVGQTTKSSNINEQESLEAVAGAFEKMVFEQVFSFTPIAKGEYSNLGYAQKNSVVNDLFKEELHKQSHGMLMDMFIKQM